MRGKTDSEWTSTFTLFNPNGCGKLMMSHNYRLKDFCFL